AVVLALAAAVLLLPGVGLAAGLLVWLVGVIFLCALAWFVGVLYREHKAAIFSLGDRWRAVLYGSVGVAVLTVTATPRLWETPGGTFAWFALIAAASYGVYATYRYS